MKNGSPEFYDLLEKAGELHNKKSHDYANNADPSGNYHFAGKLSKLFDNPDDAGFVGRIGEKLFRLANLENGGKKPLNESIEDTELDLVVIMTLWMADRIARRKPKPLPTIAELEATLVSDHLQGNSKLQFTKPPSSNPEKKILGPIEIPKGY